MKKEYEGYITVYLALTLGIMMSLIFTVLEGVRIQTIRMETEGVMDIGLYSIFGEYHRQLLEQYDLFYIDTTYGEGTPSIERTKEHLQYYLNQNFEKGAGEGLLGFRDLTELHCDNVSFESYWRASDDNGQILKGQIIDYMKDKKGISVAEDVLSHFNLIQNNGFFTRDVEGEWNEVRDQIQELLEEKRQEMADPETGEVPEIGIDNPADHVAVKKAEGILGLALPPGITLSGMVIHPEYYLSHRETLKGLGVSSVNNSVIDQAAGRLLLQEYLFEKCSYYGNTLEKSVLKYQLEYIIKGNSSDMENLQQVLEDILHIREAANIAYLFSDSEKMAQADTLALLITTVLFSPELHQAVKLSILFAWGYAESVRDIRILLDGSRVPIIKNSNNWNTPLSQLLTFTSHLGEYSIVESGMDYGDFLNLFLYMKNEKEVLYRFMDVCEMDIRITAGNEYFQMDGCVERIKAKANVSSGYGPGYEILREFSY